MQITREPEVLIDTGLIHLDGEDFLKHLIQSDPPAIILDDRIFVNEVIEHGYICRIPNNYSINNIDVTNFLDPATGAVLVAGLSAILAWVSTERRHKETLNNNQPPTPPVEPKTFHPSEEKCSHIENESICGHSFTSSVKLKGKGYLIILRACSKKPAPHTTVEYYGIGKA